MRLRAAADATVYEQVLIALQRRDMRLIDKHRQVGPRSQHKDFTVIDAFDVPIV
jgi:cytidylate kinase